MVHINHKKSWGGDKNEIMVGVGGGGVESGKDKCDLTSTTIFTVYMYNLNSPLRFSTSSMFSSFD